MVKHVIWKFMCSFVSISYGYQCKISRYVGEKMVQYCQCGVQYFEHRRGWFIDLIVLSGWYMLYWGPFGELICWYLSLRLQEIHLAPSNILVFCRTQTKGTVDEFKIEYIQHSRKWWNIGRQVFHHFYVCNLTDRYTKCGDWNLAFLLGRSKKQWPEVTQDLSSQYVCIVMNL